MKKIILPVSVIMALLIGLFGGKLLSGRKTTYEGTTTELGFKDIGELATQSVFATEVETINKDGLSIHGFNIPFTQSKYVYSYKVEIKAGYNFEEITWDVDDEKKVITINMPETKVLSIDVDRDSLIVYLQSDGVGQKVTLDEINQSAANLEKRAQEDAIANGLYENAKTNAELIIDNLVYQHYDRDTYQVVYHFQ